MADTYRIDIQLDEARLVPCTFQASRQSGKTLCVNEDGSTLCIEPWGEERPGGTPAGDPNWDSPYTWGTVKGNQLIYRSASGDNPGTPRGYLMVV